MVQALTVTGFTELAGHLLEDHLTVDNEPEGALLQMLYDSVGSSSGSGSAAGGSERTRAPLDLGALELWDSIAGEIRENAPPSDNFSEIEMLQLWVDDATNFIPSQLDLMEYMARWVQEIREKFNPPKRIPLRGATCPKCKQFKDEEGVEPLVLHASMKPPFAECSNCGTRWTAGELLDLRAQINN